MKVFQSLIDSLRFITEGVVRIFKLNDDHYPATGVVPYTDESDPQNE